MELKQAAAQLEALGNPTRLQVYRIRTRTRSGRAELPPTARQRADGEARAAGEDGCGCASPKAAPINATSCGAAAA
jgi:hypothetical protein